MYINNFLLLSQNPLKICVLLISIISKLETIFSNVSFDSLLELLKRLTLKIINTTENTDEISLMLNEKCYNEYQVIDIISYENIGFIMENSKVSLILNELWSGPYKSVPFFSGSSSFKIIDNTILTK